MCKLTIVLAVVLGILLVWKHQYLLDMASYYYTNYEKVGKIHSQLKKLYPSETFTIIESIPINASISVNGVSFKAKGFIYIVKGHGQNTHCISDDLSATEIAECNKLEIRDDRIFGAWDGNTFLIYEEDKEEETSAEKTVEKT